MVVKSKSVSSLVVTSKSRTASSTFLFASSSRLASSSEGRSSLIGVRSRSEVAARFKALPPLSEATTRALLTASLPCRLPSLATPPFSRADRLFSGVFGDSKGCCSSVLGRSRDVDILQSGKGRQIIDSEEVSISRDVQVLRSHSLSLSFLSLSPNSP